MSVARLAAYRALPESTRPPLARGTGIGSPTLGTERLSRS